jgi:hypothetical protein
MCSHQYRPTQPLRCETYTRVGLAMGGFALLHLLLGAIGEVGSGGTPDGVGKSRKPF